MAEPAIKKTKSARFSEAIPLHKLADGEKEKKKGRFSRLGIGSWRLSESLGQTRGYDSLGGCSDKLLKKMESQQGLDATCYEVAEEHLVENLVGGGIRSLCNTRPEDFGEWGRGVQLYFEFTFKFAVFSTILGIFYLFIWILCVSGDALNYLDDTSIGNVQVIAAKMSVANIGQRTLYGSSGGTNNTEFLQWLRSDKVKVLGGWWNIKDVSLIAGIADASCAAAILIFLWYWEFWHIPNVVAKHHEEQITPDIYTLFMDRLPRRLYAGGGHESYMERLKNHFELILAGLVHTKNVYKGMVVIDANDPGIPLAERPYTSVCCCCVRRAPGIDTQGRRIGNIVKVSGKSCLVQWQDSPGRPSGETQKYRYTSQNLIDAKLLWRLEMHGIERVALPKPEEGFEVGNKVKVIKESRTKGKLGVVMDPDFKGGRIQVRMDEDDEKGRIKSFLPSELKKKEEKKMKTIKSEKTKDFSRMGVTATESGDDSWQSVVYSVGLVRDFDNGLARMRAKAKEDERDLESKIRERVDAGDTMKAMKTYQQKYEEDDFDCDVKLEDRDVVGAFITFQHTKHRDFIYSEFRFSRTPFRTFVSTPYCKFNDAHMRVTEAQVPSDVYWDNLDFPRKMRFRRRLYVFGMALLLILALVLGLALSRTSAEKANERAYKNDGCDGSDQEPADCRCIRAGIDNVWNDSPPGIYRQCNDWAGKVAIAKVWGGLSSIAAITAIVIGGFVVEPMVHLERAKSVTSMNRKIMTITSVVYILALGIIRTLSNWKWPVHFLGLFGDGRYKDLIPDWYQKVGGSIIVTMTLNSIYPIVGLLQGPLYRLWVRLRKNKQALLTDLVALYTPPLFPFALRHAEQMSSLFALILFSGGMPIFGLFLPLNFWLFYVVDKYTFLRASRLPPRYTHHLIKRQVQFLQFGIWCHTMFSIWVYSNAETLPSHCTQCSESDAILGIKPSAKGLFQEWMAKCLVSSALPNTVLGVVVLASLTARLCFFFLGRNPFASSMIREGINHMKFEKSTSGVDYDNAFHSEVRAMKRIGMATSYEIQEMPGYEFLKPAQDSKPAAKILGVALGLHGLSDGVTAASSTKENVKNAVDRMKMEGVGDLRRDFDDPAIDDQSKDVKKARRKTGRLLKKLRATASAPLAWQESQSEEAVVKQGRSTEPAVPMKGKAKGKGKGKKKGAALGKVQDPEQELHLEDLAQARRNLGIGLKPASVPAVLPSKDTSEIDQLLGLKDDNSVAKPKVLSKGKGKGKGKSQKAGGTNAPVPLGLDLV